MPGTMLGNGNVLRKEISIISCWAFNKSEMTLLEQIICCKFELKNSNPYIKLFAGIQTKKSIEKFKGQKMIFISDGMTLFG